MGSRPDDRLPQLPEPPPIDGPAAPDGQLVGLSQTAVTLSVMSTMTEENLIAEATPR
jgi:hypothetical protein